MDKITKNPLFFTKESKLFFTINHHNIFKAMATHALRHAPLTY